MGRHLPPRTILLAAGGEEQARIAVLDSIAREIPVQPVASSGFTSGQAASPSADASVAQLSDSGLADLITVGLSPRVDNGKDTEARLATSARIGAVADAVARDPEVRERLAEAADLDAQLSILADEVEKRLGDVSNLAAAGAVGNFFRTLRDRVTESISRVKSAPTVTATVVAAELRPTLDDFVTRFLGDVLFYVTRRGSPAAPGPIPSVLLRELKIAQQNKEERAGEPIVLLTHSMGGQIAYDIVSSFLPTANSPTKLDYWCAAASQVGLFEELNMFLASSPDYSKATGKCTPFPASHLGNWWNVWDHNDILSFTTEGVFEEGIDDEEYWNGMSVAAAHGGYLLRPSFFRLLADKVKAAIFKRAE